MPARWPNKDPDEVLDYRLDWSARLNGDTISASTWIVPTGITRDTDSNDAKTTTLWLSGGSGGNYKLTNRITTSAGRTMEETVSIGVVNN